MELLFQDIGTSAYAMNPEICNNGSGYALTMQVGGCSHILILRSGIDSEEIRFDNPVLQDALVALAASDRLGDEWCSVGTGGIEALLLNHVRFITSGNQLRLEERAARYAIAACDFDQSMNCCKLNLPETNSRYMTVLSISVRYSVRPLVNKVRSGFGFLKKWTDEETHFYQVRIENVPGYEVGSIYYTFQGTPYRIPITSAMLGKTFLVKRYNGKAPEFHSTVDSIKLTKEG